MYSTQFVLGLICLNYEITDPAIARLSFRLSFLSTSCSVVIYAS
jgi:hypothetical protein